MSQQINLLNPAFRPKREFLTSTYVALGGVLAVILSVALAAYAQHEVRVETRKAAALEGELKAERERLAALSKQAAESRPDPALEASLKQAQGLLEVRREVAAALERGAFGRELGFAEAFRALSRLALNGLWLTGFTVGSDERDMEIRGRMLDKALLARYIQRLNAEPAFQGARFAALSMKGIEEAAPTAEPAAKAAPSGASALAVPAAVAPPARYIEFTLRAAGEPGDAKGAKP